MKILETICLILSCALLSHSCNKVNDRENTGERPNFLVLISDDQTFQSIGNLNNEEVITPTLDRLVETGVTFTHSFNQGSWSGAVCVASRTMLITGQTVFRTARNYRYLDDWSQLYGPASHQLQKDPDEDFQETEVKTWAETFAEAGYLTFMTGKWHNSDYALLKGFEQAEAVGAGMYETVDETGSRDFAYLRPNGSEWVPWNRSFEGHWTPEVKDIIYSESGEKKISSQYEVFQHTSELYADKAINFLQTKARDSDRPFFMYVAFNAPHDPRQSPEEYVKMYTRDSLKIPVNFLPEHPFDQGDHRIRDEILCVFPRTEEAVRLHRNEYYAILSHFDHEAGRILKALENSGKAGNTYIMFTSDHGLAVGQHGLMGKQNQYDHSIRMPLIIAGPGLEHGKKVDEKVYMQSLFATSCDLAGIDVPETVEFGSLMPLLHGKDLAGEEYIFGTYRHLQRMIRSDEFKLIVYPEVKKIQLFNLIEDPWETNNLAGDDDYTDTIQILFNKLIEKQEELDDYLVLDKNEYLQPVTYKPQSK